MASLTTQIRSILNGSKAPAATTGEMKNALDTLVAFVTDLLGTDSTDKAAARKALGVSGAAGVRNLVHNPDFHFNTRDYVSGAAASGKRYTLDRWRMTSDGASVTFGPASPGRTVTIGSNPLEQIIEAKNISGGTYCIAWEGTATCTINGTSYGKGETFTLPTNTDASLQFANGTVTKVQLERESVGAWEDVDRELQRQVLEAYCVKSKVAIQGVSTFVSGNDFTRKHFRTYPLRAKLRTSAIDVSFSNQALPPLGTSSGVTVSDISATATSVDYVMLTVAVSHVGGGLDFHRTADMLIDADI